MDRALTHRRRGDSIVEFAILAPTLVLILFGVLELGRVVDAWLVVHNAAREGARAGVLVYPDSASLSAAQTAATAYLNAGLGPGIRSDIAAISAPTVWFATTAATNDTVEVSTGAYVQLYTPIFQSMFGSTTVHVGAIASMRRQ